MKTLKALLQKKMFITLLMGLSSGMPLLLTSKTLQAWMTMENVDLKSIGLFALAGLPTTLKFLWAPIFDAITPPLGRRRGWILICQILLTSLLAFLAFTQPSEDLYLIAGLCVAISFLSASQDIVVDALRREHLNDNEMGLGSTFYIYGYRIAMWISGALALILASYMSWQYIYLIMAAVMGICTLFTLMADEPAIEGRPPRTFKEASLGPLIEFFSRSGAWGILAFVLLYKVGDTLAGAMATPFYLKIGYTPVEIGLVAKTAALAYVLTGGLIGGLLIYRYGILRCLMAFGILQAVSTAGFVVLANTAAQLGSAPNLWFLGGVIALEDISGGMGTAAFVAYMAAQTDKRFTATQYALLSSLMAVPRVILSAQTGFLAEYMGVLPSASYVEQAHGWTNYFLFCTVVAVPGLLLLVKMGRDSKPSEGVSTSEAHAAT